MGIVMLVLVAAIALTLAATSEQDDDMTAPQLLAPLSPPRVIASVVAAPPESQLSFSTPPAYQPPRNV